MSRSLLLSGSFSFLVLGACQPLRGSSDAQDADSKNQAPNVVHVQSQDSIDSPEKPRDDGRGGRLFDRFFAKTTFTPDDKKTPGQADGQGGPFGNGTLALADGKPLLNDVGHDYRLKNFFGWDLRGQEGIAGPRYQNKPGIVATNLLITQRPAEDLKAWITRGSDVLPAYGSVLSAEEIESLIDFIVATRDGRLPRPEAIWALSEGTPGNYRLNAGADVARGHELYADKCSGCHGDDGTRISFDGGEYSLGSHARQKAYEDWFKIVNGQPGTKMVRFVEGDGKAMAQQTLDLLAALCDRTKYPRGAATGTEVPDGDPRCGSYLK